MASVLIQSHRKFLSAIWNLVTKTYPKFATFHSFFKVFTKLKKKLRNFENPTNSLFIGPSFTDLLKTFQYSYYAKQFSIFFKFSLYRKIQKSLRPCKILTSHDRRVRILPEFIFLRVAASVHEVTKEEENYSEDQQIIRLLQPMQKIIR